MDRTNVTGFAEICSLHIHNKNQTSVITTALAYARLPIMPVLTVMGKRRSSRANILSNALGKFPAVLLARKPGILRQNMMFF